MLRRTGRSTTANSDEFWSPPLVRAALGRGAPRAKWPSPEAATATPAAFLILQRVRELRA
jgi:hypothetical protein